MAYSSITDSSYFGLPAVLERKCYDNDLTGEACSDEDYKLVKHVVNHFKICDQGEYHDMCTSSRTFWLLRTAWRRCEAAGGVTAGSTSSVR